MKHPKHKCPPPEGMIGPRVMCLSRLIRKVANETLAEQGIFSGQQDIVLTLDCEEGLTLSALAKRLDVAVATASISVKRMEKAGFIVRKPDENDARVTRLYLTEKGKNAPQNVKTKIDSVEDIFKKGMNKEEIDVLSSLLDRAIDNFMKEEIE